MVLGLALAARLWSIDFGLPNEHARPDERHLIGFTLTTGGNGLNPGFFNYPSLYLYILLAFYVGYLALGRMTGHFHSPMDLVAEYSIAPDNLYLIDRVLVASLGTATVALVYLIVKQLLGTRAALLAALFLALSYLHVRESHFGTVDVPVTFFATLAIAMILRARQMPSLKSNLLAGLCVGLAISTKYNAVALLLPLLWCQVLQWEVTPASERADRAVRWLLPGIAAVALGFVAGTPFAVLDHSKFIHDVIYEMVDKGRNLPEIDQGPGWLYHAHFTLPYGLGLPLLLAALAGLALWLRSDWRTALLLAGFSLAWYVGMGSSHYVFVRYMVPLVPVLCMFAAYAVEQLAQLFVRHWGEGGRARAALALACSALLAMPAHNIVQWNRLVGLTDTRVLASWWIETHVPSGQTVGLTGIAYVRPDLWSTASQMRRANAANSAQGRGLRNEMRIAHLERTGAASYEKRVFERGMWVDELNPEGSSAEPPSFVVMVEHPAWKPGPGSIPQLSEDYAQVAAFTAFTAEAAAAVFDLQDAVYFPYANFAGILGPGPNIRIFERRGSR